MTVYEAHDVVISLLDLMIQTNSEAMQFLDIWAGVSFALVGAAFLAPKRLTWGVTTLLLGLYLAFSGFVLNTFIQSASRIATLVLDANTIAMSNQIDISYLESVSTPDGSFQYWLFIIFFFGLLLGTLGFTIKTCFSNHRKDS
ncbi:MAG: hypothetical protein GKR91_20715 [Pseudomonadales bacterium]|nr:hypothetical protein [Pseudomonadales bacterium]